MASKELRLVYTGDVTGVKKSLSSIDKMHQGLGDRVSSIGRTLTSVGRTWTAGVTLPIVAGGVLAVNAFTDMRQQNAQTRAALQSTGGAANVTFKDIRQLATGIGDLSAQDDQLVQQGANVLLTFTNVRNEIGRGNDIFNQASLQAANLSARMGIDLVSANTLLGKALNDPLKGITALTRVGVTFTEQQKKQIAVLMKQGDVVGAQKIILHEMNKEFGGSAKAAGDAASPFTKLKLIFDDVATSIGKILMPMLEKVGAWVKQAAAWFKGLSPEVKKMAVIFALVAAAIGPVLIVFGSLATALGAISAPVLIVIAVLAALVAAGIAIQRNWDEIMEAISPVIDYLKDLVIPIWQALVEAWTTNVVPALSTLWEAFQKLLPAIKAIVIVALIPMVAMWWAILKVLPIVIKIIGTIIRVIANLINAIADVVSWLRNQLGDAFSAVWRAAQVVWEKLKTGWDAVKKVTLAVWNAIKAAARTVWNAIKIAIITVVNTLKGLLSTAWNAIKSVAQGVWQAIKTVIMTPVQAVKESVLTVFRALKGALATIWNGIKATASAVWEAIAGIVKSVWNGIAGAWNGTVGKISISVPSWVPVVGGKGFDMPDLPYLAKGGIITKPMIAMLAERQPEVVIPLDRLEKMLGPQRGAEHMHPIVVDRRKFARSLDAEYLGRGW